MRPALAGLLALLVLFSAAAPLLAADADSEDRLRRRVKRFYVLNYLNRYGEMWEMFSDDLRERLGDDRRDYVKSSRRSGFELYSSRIEDVKLKGEVAAVEVVVQAQLAGMLDVSTKRHRMLWRFEDGNWRYAGSIDISHEVEGEAPVNAADLLPPSRTRAPEVGSKDLLPPRVRVEAGTKSPPTETQRAPAGAAERWDLVAVPPPGRSGPSDPPVATPEAGSELSEPAGEQLEPETRVAEAEQEATPQWLPPEMTSAPPAPPPAPAGEESIGSSAAYDEGSRLVRKAVDGNLPRRTRALTRLRELNEPRLAPLMARAVPEAPKKTAEAFLAELARYRAFEQTGVVVETLGRSEPALRRAAARALIVLGEAAHAEALARALDKEIDDAAFAQELLAYAAVTGEEAAPRIAATLSDENRARLSRTAAARAAGACGCDLAEEPLLAMLRREGKASVSRVGLLAAGRIGGEASLALLEELAAQRLRLPAESSDDLDGVLEARRALALASVPGAGHALAALLLDRGLRAGSEDVVLVASTGDRDALLSLLAHPAPAIRRRSADLVGRVIETDEDASRALAAIEDALVEERDRVTLDAFLDARERLEAVPTS